MNDSEVSKQVHQMVQFIKQEAEEKANEIFVAAEEEFNIEKLQLVEAEKRKLKQEYERKDKQVEIAKKIDYSKQLNASRLKLLQAQDSLVKAMKGQAESELRELSSDEAVYKDLIKNLIIQGIERLKEPALLLKCREEDLELVTEALESALEEYSASSDGKTPTVDLDTSRFLPSAPLCSGGVAMASKDGKVVCSNTLDARLEIAFKQTLPAIRKAMFKESIVA